MGQSTELRELVAIAARAEQGDSSVPAVLLADFARPIRPQRPDAKAEFRTATRDASPLFPSLAVALHSPNLRVLPLEKTARNPYGGFVFIGRASTCDVIVRDASVSKSHAVFQRVGAQGEWFVKDNRSHNGTFVNERKLVSGERHKLESGDAIRFGAYPVYVIMPGDVRRILETMGPVHE